MIMLFKKLQILLIFVFCFFSCGLFAQTEVNKYLHEVQSVKSDTDKVRLYTKIGDYFRKASSFDSALYYYNIALRITKSPVAAENIANIFNNIGVAYGKSGVYDKALNCFVTSLTVAEKLQNRKLIAEGYSNIGTILCTVEKDYAKALEFYDKSLKIFKETGYYDGIVSCYINISEAYMALKILIKE